MTCLADVQRPSRLRRVLVTGATGGVGSELLRAFEACDGIAATGMSRTGGKNVVQWDFLGDPPQDIRHRWDVVVHAAASTRWTMSVEEAIDANLRPTQRLLNMLPDETRLVYLSTAHVTGRTGSVDSSAVEDYRNTYEWSKAACERLVRERPNTVIVRFPIVFGRRSDGHLDRYSGMFKLIPAISSGLVPAVVGVETAPFDIVAVDELAAKIVDAALSDDARMVRIGCGPAAATVDDVVDIAVAALNEWRGCHGHEPIQRPPLLPPDRWHRFFLPFARQHFSPLQLKTIDVFSEFEPYFCMTDPFEVDQQVTEPHEVIRRTVGRWAEDHPRGASRAQLPWR